MIKVHLMHLGFFLCPIHPVVLARNGSVPTLGERADILKIGVVPCCCNDYVLASTVV